MTGRVTGIMPPYTPKYILSEIYFDLFTKGVQATPLSKVGHVLTIASAEIHLWLYSDCFVVACVHDK